MQDQGAGRFITWPALSFLGFTVGFADSNAARLMPCLRAMLARVSPAAMVWVCTRAVADGDAVRWVEEVVLDAVDAVVADGEVTSSGAWLVFCGGAE